MRIVITDNSHSYRYMMSGSKEDVVLNDSEIEDNEKLLFFLSLSKGDYLIISGKQWRVTNKIFDVENNKILIDVVR